MPYNLPSTLCPLLSTPRRAHTVSCPYRATMDIHQLINSDVEDSRPSRELAETLLEEDMSEMSEDKEELVVEEEEEDEGAGGARRRGRGVEGVYNSAFYPGIPMESMERSSVCQGGACCEASQLHGAVE